MSLAQALQGTWKVRWVDPKNANPGMAWSNTLHFQNTKITLNAGTAQLPDWAPAYSLQPDGLTGTTADSRPFYLYYDATHGQLTCYYYASASTTATSMLRSTFLGALVGSLTGALAGLALGSLLTGVVVGVTAAVTGSALAARQQRQADSTQGGSSGAVFVAESGGSGMPQEPPQTPTR